MTLLAKKPEIIKPRMKFMLYGDKGTGKSTTAVQFPKPYVIDTEGGTEHKDYAQKIIDNDGVRLYSCDYDEIKGQVIALMTEDHDYKSLVIDSLTPIYENLAESFITTKPDGKPDKSTLFNSHYKKAGRKIFDLINLCLRLDMNIIITAREKNKWEKEKMVGEKADLSDNACYDLDFVLHCKLDTDIICEVDKTRLAKEFKLGENFKLSYEEIVKRYTKAYDDSFLTEKCKPSALASEEQVSEIKHLFHILNVDETIVTKGIRKAKASSLREMPANLIQKWIDALKEKMHPEKKS